MSVKKWTALVAGCVLAGMVATVFVRAAVQTIAGLAVANGTVWTNLKDASFGDGATNGVAMFAPMLWNGTSFVRALGDATNGIKVNVVAGTITANIPANASVNLSQVAGTTTAVGNGVSGAGNIRANLASDNTAIANWGQGATGSGVPSGAVYIGGDASGNLTGQVICDKFLPINNFSTSGSTQEVAASGSTKVYICGFTVNSASTTAVTAKLVYGTGVNCATSPSDLSVAVPLQAATSSAPVGQNVAPPSNVVWSTPASQAVCINLSAAQAVDAQFWYTQF